MGHTGRISSVIIYVTIVLGWHSLYFVSDFHSAYWFLLKLGQYKWDLVLLPLLSPLFWWTGLQYDRAKFLSEKDALTGLYNRHFVSNSTPKLLAKIDRKTDTLTITEIDCNNFKQINDQYGHKLGDLVLTNISSILLNSISKKDIAARWGGDEFLIVSPYSDLSQTKAASNKLEERLFHLSRELGIEISVSIGTAVYPADGGGIDELLAVADRYMYECKGNMKQAR